jgi:hypothetical protein
MKSLIIGIFCLVIAGCETNTVSEVPTYSSLALTTSLLPVANNTIEVGKSGKPYDSLKPAIAAASAGDLVVVFPGVYNDSTPTVLKDSVDIYLHDEARIVNNRVSVSQDEGTVFWDINGPVRMGIYGHGVIEYTGGFGAESFCITLRNPESEVYVEADSLLGHEMALSAEGGRLIVKCPEVIAYCEHGIRTRNGGFVDLTGNLKSLNVCNDGGGQAVYFQGNEDTVIIRGDILHEGISPAILDNFAGIGVFILYGDIIAKNSRAINMTNGKAYLNGSIVRTKGAIKAENLYASKVAFDQTGFGYVFGTSVGDTAYLTACVGDSGINPLSIWYGDYRQYGMGKIRHRK